MARAYNCGRKSKEQVLSELDLLVMIDIVLTEILNTHIGNKN